MKTLIAQIALSEHIPLRHSEALLRMVTYTQAKAPSVQLATGSYYGTSRAEARFNAIAHALDLGVDQILFVSENIAVPAPTLIQLMGRREDIIGAILPIPGDVVRCRGKQPGNADVINMPLGDGALTMDWVSADLMLVDIGVITTTGAPWFKDGFDETEGRWVGSSEIFCSRARIMGFSVYADLKLSRAVTVLAEKGVYFGSEKH